MADVDFDYLALEPLLIARISATVSGLQAVQGVADLASLADKQQITPAVYVIYLGDIVGTMAGNAQPTDQVWAVVPTVYYADPSDTGEGARRLAGPLITRTLAALSNWRPRQDMKPLRRMASSTPAAYDNGYGYFPLLFTSGFVFIPNRSPAP